MYFYFKSLCITIRHNIRSSWSLYTSYIFQYIADNFKTSIIRADVNIHSRSDRRRTQFLAFINTSTNGLLQPIPKPNQSISQTGADIVILFPNLKNRTHLEYYREWSLSYQNHHPESAPTSTRRHPSAPKPTLRPWWLEQLSKLHLRSTIGRFWT